MNSTATTPFQSRYPWLQSYLDYILDDIDLPQLPGHYRGKVRDNYDLPDGRRILVSSDRLSAFDRNIVCVPLKGQVLTQVARFWFEETQDICPNHVVAYPDPNVVVGKRLKMLPVEMVVRDYMAGTTSTSILSLYKKGQRSMYGHTFPDGMRDNQKLPHTIITPTSKAGHGDHDAPLTPTEIVETGLLGESLWQKVSAAALALFARGRELAARRGLILVDTKYEFGLDENGSLVLADEVHTPDSSRYWWAESYAARFAAGEKPESLDKDFIRTWVTARCDPYKDPIPAIPPEIVLEAAAVYVGLYETMTGKAFVPPEKKTSPLERVRENLRAYLGRMA